MKKLNNYDLRMSSGLIQRADVKAVINEVIDRLNDSYEKLLEMDVIPADEKETIIYNQSFYTLDCIFAFLASCGIFSANTYKVYFEELQKMKLDDVLFYLTERLR